MGWWSAPEFDTPEDRALRRLSLVAQPAGVEAVAYPRRTWKW